MNNDIQNEIIKHCRLKFKTISKDHLKKNEIRTTLFLEIMYEQCLSNYYKTNDYRLSDDDLQAIYSAARTTVLLTQEYLAGKCELMSINDDDILFFKIRRSIEQTNTNTTEQTNNE